MQRAGHSRVGHRANEYRDVLSKTTKEETDKGQEKTRVRREKDKKEIREGIRRD